MITNKKSTTRFPMSLRWTAYVALWPPKRDQNAKWQYFVKKCTLLEESLLRSMFVWILSVTKLKGIHWPLYACKNGLSGTFPSTWKFDRNWPTYLKRRFSYQYSLVAPQP